MLELYQKGLLFECLPRIFKKLVLVLATSILTIEASKKVYTPPTAKNTPPLKYVLCIHQFIQFKKGQVKVQALLNFGNKINVMTSAYVASLELKV